MEKMKVSAAFVQAQKGFAPALKTSSNPHFRSKYASLDACIEAVIDSLNANGIALMQQTKECDSGVVVETIFLHESGEFLSGGVLHVPAVKHDAQGYGSALTYARRYSLMAACGIAPEDDDGNAASKQKSAQPKHRPVDGAVLSAQQQSKCNRVASAIQERMAAQDVVGAYGEWEGLIDTEEKTYTWSMLDAQTRRSIKEHGAKMNNS
jgi:hypothetical protein